jgi:hypothetical protein
MPLPEDYSLLDDLAQLKADLRLVRQWRNIRVITRSGDTSIRWVPGRATLDLRSLSASGAVSADEIPSVTGHTSAVLTTNGATTSWLDVQATTLTWLQRLIAAGGTLGASSLSIAEDLAAAIGAASYASKIVYLLPLLGKNLTAARVPLIDRLSKGLATSNSFTESDFSEGSGLTGNGSSKWFQLPLRASQIGASNAGGMGFWLGALGATGPAQYVIGSYSLASGGQIFALYLHNTVERFWWGDANSIASTGSASTVAHYYGQKISTTDRKLYRDGTQIASDSGTVDEGGSADQFIGLLHLNGYTHYSTHTCACAYLTDGTMSGSDITAFHSLLQTYLITPTGR